MGGGGGARGEGPSLCWVQLSLPYDCRIVNHPSGGLYLEHQEVGIAQYLLATFLPSQSCRKYLKQRCQQTVDFRAACFCHKRVVDIAYV